MASEEKSIKEQKTTASSEESSVLAEYLELFNYRGYFKYFLAANAQLDWFETLHVRTPLRIHGFLLEKFEGKCSHANFEKAISCGPIESTASHMRIRMLTHVADQIINPRNSVPGVTSLKTRAESDVEGEDVEMDAAGKADETATSSNRVRRSESVESSEESEEYNIRRCKRMKYSAQQMSPFSYLRRLPTKIPQATVDSSDEDSSDDNHDDIVAKSKKQQTSHCEYSDLRYLESTGTIVNAKSQHLGGELTERPVRLRIGYRKHLTNNTTQFALIIYERLDQKVRQIRSRRVLDFSKCTEDEEQSIVDDSNCLDDTQPAVIRSNEGGAEREIIASVATPTSAEIATALEEAAFTIQPPIQRTPTKATPIPPGTPKRRPRSTQLNMSGVVPISMTPAKMFNATPGTTPKLSAARSLRL